MTDFLIAGAGPAGLTAALEILDRKLGRPVILEESARIGGISCTVDHNGNHLDIGGHRFFSKSERVRRFWERIMPHTPTPSHPDREMLTRHRVSRIYFLRHFLDYPLSLSWATLRSLGFRRILRIGAGYLKACISPLPESSLENFYINRFGRPLYRMFFEEYTEKVWGLHPSKLGADWGAQRVKGISVGAVIRDMIARISGGRKSTETSLIESFDYPRLGPGQLWEAVADEIVKAGGRIILNTKVTEVNVADGRVSSVTAIDDKGNSHTYPCSAFFSSMPLNDLTASLHGINVPGDVAATAANLPFRDFLTVGLLVDRLAISAKDGSLIPDNWIYIQDHGVKLGRLQVFNNWSPYMVADPEHSVWLGLEYFCKEGDELWNMEDTRLAKMGADELTRIGIITSDTVTDFTVVRMKKAYPSYYGSYTQLPDLREFLLSIPNLYCIGRNGQHRYNNMDHSMLTAMLAVDALAGEADSRKIWEVNSEGEYHEEKN